MAPSRVPDVVTLSGLLMANLSSVPSPLSVVNIANSLSDLMRKTPVSKKTKRFSLTDATLQERLLRSGERSSSIADNGATVGYCLSESTSSKPPGR